MKDVKNIEFLSIIVAGLLVCCSCSTNSSSNLLQNSFGREITISEIISTNDEQYDRIINSSLKILVYTDSTGCVPCKFNPSFWKRFIQDIISITNTRVPFIFVFNNKYQDKLDKFIVDYGFNYPMYCYGQDFVSDYSLPTNIKPFVCLLDSDNRIILIGNPAASSKVKELYIRTICERLGIEQPKESVEPHRKINKLGVFNWQKEQHTSFVANNDNDEPMYIDSLYTSCECTKATIDKTEIAPHDKAVVNVKFKADRPEQFMREIYADVRGGEQIVMVIEGEAIE